MILYSLSSLEFYIGGIVKVNIFNECNKVIDYLVNYHHRQAYVGLMGYTLSFLNPNSCNTLLSLYNID